MAERRPLIEGIKSSTIESKLEKDFVYGSKTDAPTTPKATPKAADIREPKSQPPIIRVPLTTRIRADFASALKRESLERQLNGQFPNSLQEILEEALESWMLAKGHLQ